MSKGGGKWWKNMEVYCRVFDPIVEKKKGLVTQKEIPTNSRNTNKEVTTFDFIYFQRLESCRVSDFVWLSICRNGFPLSHRRPAISFLPAFWNWIDAGARQLATTATFLVSNTVDKSNFPIAHISKRFLSVCVCVSMCVDKREEEKGGESTASSKVGWILFRMELLLPVCSSTCLCIYARDRQRETGRNGGDET